MAPSLSSSARLVLSVSASLDAAITRGDKAAAALFMATLRQAVAANVAR